MSDLKYRLTLLKFSRETANPVQLNFAEYSIILTNDLAAKKLINYGIFEFN